MFQPSSTTLEEACPRNRRIALTILPFLVGLVLGTALLNTVQVESGVQPDAAVSLAAQPRTVQPARLQQPAQQPRTRQFLQPMAVSRSEPEIDIVVGRREAAAAFAAVLSAAFAPQSANAAGSSNALSSDLRSQKYQIQSNNANSLKTGGDNRKWGTTASSNGRRNLYDVDAPSVGERPTDLADTSKIVPRSFYGAKYDADTSYEQLANGLKPKITENLQDKKSGIRK